MEKPDEQNRRPPGALPLGALALRLGAALAPGDAADVCVDRVSSPMNAGPTSLVFATDAASYTAAIESAAAAVITTEALGGADTQGKPRILTANAKLAFARAARLMRPAAPAAGVDPRAAVAADAVLGAGVSVGPFAVIESGAQLGDGVTVGAGAVVSAGCVVGTESYLHPRVVLYPSVRLGARVVVHAGAVLGSDGFGYVRDAADGAYTQFPQQGLLIIEDDVEIGANTTIDRGALEETRIRRGVKIDNLVPIGHNVEIGEHVVIAAQTGVSGSSAIGSGAVVAGQVGIADHVTIGPGAILGAQCGVPSNKQLRGPGVLFWGTPARPIAQYLKELAALARMARTKGRGAAKAD